jgi:hypothetical protein
MPTQVEKPIKAVTRLWRRADVPGVSGGAARAGSVNTSRSAFSVPL